MTARSIVRELVQNVTSESRIGDISKFLQGSHVMGPGPGNDLESYHAAKAVVNASRKKDPSQRIHAVKQALRNHHVQVGVSADKIKIHRPDTRQDIHI
jgi:hypothetical protein